MSDSSRRDFLKTSALVGGGLMATDFLALTRAALASDPVPAMSIARWDEAALAGADLALAAGVNSAAGAREPGGEWLASLGALVTGVIAVVSSGATLDGMGAALYFASRLSRPSCSCNR